MRIPCFDEFTHEPTFISSDFEEPVLYGPARTELEFPCNSLRIVTGYTDCERISTHMINLSDGIQTHRFVRDLSVEIILGMTRSGLSANKHRDICRLMEQLNSSRNMPRISCRYICSGPEVHSKVFVWSQPYEDIPQLPHIAFTGSLNYTMNAFYRRRESVSQCSALLAYQYFEDLLPDTIDCLDPEAGDRLQNVINNVPAPDEPDNSEADYLRYNQEQPVDTITVSLLKADGSDTGYGSGINWGIRPNGTRRNPNQAYIPYNTQDRRPGFFPDRINPDDPNCPIFRVITRDFGSFHMRMAQQGNKALQSAESNAILGEWIRRRLNVPMGGYVTKQMLELYGRTDVTFRKYADGTYLLDF